jgi:DNA repair photolyase
VTLTLRPSKGKMFKSVTHTATIYQGCNHKCVYCWAECMGINHTPRLMIKEKDWSKVLKVRNAVIFLNSAHDSFSDCIPKPWIKKMLAWIKIQHPSNKFLLQTKNTPALFGWLKDLLEIKDRIRLGTTLETDRAEEAAKLSRAPPPSHRAYALAFLREKYGFETFLSLEPLVEFTPSKMLTIVRAVAPVMIEIGIDNWRHKHGHKLRKPSISRYLRFRRYLVVQGWNFIEKDSLKKWLRQKDVDSS